MPILILAAVTVIAVAIGCLVYYRSVRRAAKRPITNPSRRAERRAELTALSAGDTVVVVGKAAAPKKQVVRTITAADRRYLWVGTQRYRRSDGWQADAQGYETDITWLREMPPVAKAA